jgi:predicted RNase H-like HicB family nuclease
MNYPLVFEKVSEPGFPEGYCYAHLPTLGLSTHGEGIAGARKAAEDLAGLWISELRNRGEAPPRPGETLLSTLEVPEHALQGA